MKINRYFTQRCGSSYSSLTALLCGPQIKSREGDEKKYGSDIESDTESEEGVSSIIEVYKDILDFLKEGETIARALKVWQCAFVK